MVSWYQWTIKAAASIRNEDCPLGNKSSEIHIYMYTNVYYMVCVVSFGEMKIPVKLVWAVSPSVVESVFSVPMSISSSKHEEDCGREGVGEGERGEEEVTEGRCDVVEFVVMENVLLGREGGWGGRGDCTLCVLKNENEVKERKKADNLTFLRTILRQAVSMD